MRCAHLPLLAARGKNCVTAPMNTRIRSFPPLMGTNPRLLILGSMPGIASLTASQYYAHPRNRFWTILGECLGFDPSLDYVLRVQALHQAGIAVWDVLAECERVGSLDTAIMRDSEQANNIPDLLTAHPSIHSILLNGAKAASSLRRHHPEAAHMAITLPSTSPANASMQRQMLVGIWGKALQIRL